MSMLQAFVSVRDFGAVGDGVTDDTAAIQAAIEAVKNSSGGGKIIFVPAGIYRLTAPLRLHSGTSLLGDGRGKAGATIGDLGATTLRAVHTGSAVLSLKGAGYCNISNLNIETDATTYPKTGIALGRDSVSSAGHHKIEYIRVQGRFSEAAIYSIASEVNTWIDIYVWNLNGAGRYGFYTSASDDLVVDDFVASSNVACAMVSPYIVNSSSDASAACIYLESDEGMGSWNFYNAYMIPYRGSYVHINNATDAQMLGPVSFFGGSGERLSGGDPTHGIRITSSVDYHLHGLVLNGCRFDLQSGASRYTIAIDSTVTLTQPNIVINRAEAFPYASTQFWRDKIKGGVFSVGRFADWTAIALESGWSSKYGFPFAQPEWSMDAFGNVSLRGTVIRSGGSATMAVLPVAPAQDMLVVTEGDGATARIRVDASGNVTLFSGSANTNLELSPVRWRDS